MGVAERPLRPFRNYISVHHHATATAVLVRLGSLPARTGRRQWEWMSAMHPTVSATIVTYNSERYITRCLETLRAQTYPCLEIIVVDNGSTDCTCALVKRFQASRIIHNHENAGYCRAQNQAITASGGDWILCVNPDTELQSD